MIHIIHPLIFWLASHPACPLLLSLMALSSLLLGPRNWLHNILSHRVALLVAYACIFLYTMIVIAYLCTSVLIEHLEPTLIMNAAAWIHGFPMYPGLRQPELYGMLYGPVPAILVGLGQILLGATIFACKFPIIACSLSTAALLYYLLRREFGHHLAIIGSAICLISLLLFHDYSYSVRVDPVLVFFVCLALFASRIARFWPNVLLGALALALAADAKAHAPLYILPALALMAEESGLLRPIMIVLLGALLGLLPFYGLPNISLPFYIHMLLLGLKEHRLLYFQPLWLLTWLLLAIFPCCLAAVIITDSWEKFKSSISRHYILLIAMAVSFLLTTLIASKEGAGPHHYMPYAPFLAYLFCRMVSRGKDGRLMGWRLKLLPVMATAWALAVIFVAGVAQTSIWRHILRERAMAGAALSNIRSAERRFPGAAIVMGYRAHESPSTYYRAQLVMDGNPPFMDAAAMMDRREAGLSLPHSVIHVLKSGRISLFLIPRQSEPLFTLRSWYQSKYRLFNSSFRHAFLDNYSHVGNGQVFEYWVYKGYQRLPVHQGAESKIAAMR